MARKLRYLAITLLLVSAPSLAIFDSDAYDTDAFDEDAWDFGGGSSSTSGQGKRQKGVTLPGASMN